MGKDFKNAVYLITRRIPKGKVATYKQVALMAGNVKAARMVGFLMKINQDAPNTPCHRVIGSDGSLIGYSAGNGVSTKKQLLLSEGVYFKKDKVNLVKSQWSAGI